MKIQGNTKNVGIYAGGDTNVLLKREEKQNGRKSYFAGNLPKSELQDQIALKKQEARRQALKVVGDAWSGDRSIDAQLDVHRENVRKLQQDNKAANDQIQELTKQQEDMKAASGITDDSQEQKDLELLRKDAASLTEEERERCQELYRNGLTQYQKEQLSIDSIKEDYQSTVERNKLEIEGENAIIRGIRLERLKSAPMVNATEQAEDIMEASSQEIIGMVVEDAKEKLDEEQEEREKKAEELEEQKEEQEAFIEAQKEKQEEQEEILEDMPAEEVISLDQVQNDVQNEVQNILNKMNLVIEDLKGAVVDKNL